MYFLKDNYKNSLFFLFLLLSCLSGKSITVPDSLLKTTAVVRSFETAGINSNSPCYSFVFDDSGILFIGQKDKISVYNGFSWSYVYQDGEILVASFSGKKIFFAGGSSFGFLQPDSLQQISIHLLDDFLPEPLKNFGNADALLAVGKTLYFKAGSFLVSWDSKKFSILDSNFKTGRIFKCSDELLAVVNSRITVYRENNKERSFSFGFRGLNNILPVSKGYLITGFNGNYCLTDSSFKLKFMAVIPGLKNISQSLQTGSGLFLLADSEKNMSVIDSTGNIVLPAFDAPDLAGSAIKAIQSDASGNVWVLQERSLSRIENPLIIRLLSRFPDEYGRITDIKTTAKFCLVASTKGLFSFLPAEKTFKKTGVSEFCYRLIPCSAGILAVAEKNIYLFSGEEVSRIFSGNIINVSFNPVSEKLLISETERLWIYTFSSEGINRGGPVITPVTPLKTLITDSLLWVSNGRELLIYDKPLNSQKPLVELKLPPVEFLVDLFAWQNKPFVLSTSGVYSLSGKEFIFERSLSDEICSQPFQNFLTDRNGKIWFQTSVKDKSTSLHCGDPEGNIFSTILLPPVTRSEFFVFDYQNTSSMFISEGRSLFSFYPGSYRNQNNLLFPVIKKISAGDKTLFSGISYEYFKEHLERSLKSIPFNHNDIRVELSCTDFFDSDIRYQHLLSGNDKIWSDWSSNNFIALKDLREGDYLLKIRCKNEINPPSPEISLYFHINPPFYRTLWAYFFYLVASGILLFILYKTYLINLHRRAEILSDREREQDIIEPIPAAYAGPQNKNFNIYSNIDEEKAKDKTKWDKYEMVTVLFSDIQGFTKIAESMNPESLIDELDRFFFHFDSVVEKYNIEKIKTIGDAYMAAGGIPKKSVTNPIEVVLAALEMQNYMKQLKKTKVDIWDLRIGIHSGPVIAGIIGHKKRSFDIWGDTVNTASRMESTGEAGKVNISSETYKLVKDFFICEYRGKLPVKYKGDLEMYFVKGLRPELSVNLIGLPNRKFFLKLQMLKLNDLEEMIFKKLETDLDKNLFFHNYEYCRHVYEYSGLISKAEDIDQEETLLIRTAVLLINTGFSMGYENQENRSAQFARDILPEFNYSDKQISSVSNLILSSKWPPKPMNQTEMILYDIKMEFLGRADYPRLLILLFHEESHFLKSFEKNDFKKRQISLLQEYPFFTQSGKRLREISAEQQIAAIRDIDFK
jgi:adenylate cyclase